MNNNSMAPNISQGDLLIIKESKHLKYENLKENDVVQFNYKGYILTHRIIEVKDKKHNKIDVVKQLSDIIEESCMKNGKTTLIAVFSVQRLQEILYYLYKCYEKNPTGKIIC